MQGYGTETWETSNKVYSGYFAQGFKDGEGVISIPAKKKIYAGQFSQNTYNGIGIEFNFKAGTCRMADWRKGKIMQWLGKRKQLSNINAAKVLDAYRADKSI